MPTPSDTAAADLHDAVQRDAPGWTFLARRNGLSWASAPSGDARRGAGPSHISMSDKTIIHIASMSKPICATAFVAMLDDWQSLRDRISNLGAEPVVKLKFIVEVWEDYPGHKPPRRKVPDSTQVESVPAVLAPLFSSRGVAQDLLSAGIGNLLPAKYTKLLQQFVKADATSETVVDPVPLVPPGYTGLLRKIVAKVAVPRFNDPFLPFVKSRIKSVAAALGRPLKIGGGIEMITFEQLIIHQSTLPNGISDLLFPLVPGGKNAVIFEPADGSRVTFDLWTYLYLLLCQTANAPIGYKNDNYTVLGAVVDDCTGGYDDYVYARLFHDSRFSDIRRYVTHPARAAYYYRRDGSHFTAGNPLPDYRGFAACGGFYTTAAQMTDWLRALYEREQVTGVVGCAPLVSEAGHDKLFGATRYFSGGHIENPRQGWTSFPHNGAANVGVGSVNGKMAILVGPSALVTAFFAANGALNAEIPFNKAIADLLPLA